MGEWGHFALTEVPSLLFVDDRVVIRHKSHRLIACFTLFVRLHLLFNFFKKAVEHKLLILVSEVALLIIFIKLLFVGQIFVAKLEVYVGNGYLISLEYRRVITKSGSAFVLCGFESYSIDCSEHNLKK
jgi:hypothetical protein